MNRFLFFITSLLIITSCSSEFNGISPEEYIEQNNIEATELTEGVFIQIHEEGDSRRINDNEVLIFDYRAILANTGETIAEGTDEISLFTNLLQGWQVGLKEIGIGGSCTLVLHPDWAFGGVELESLPANSTTAYEITIKDMLSETTVDGYIERNNYQTTELEKGVHIVILEPGNNVKPTVNSEIEVNYVGKLTNELVFDQGEGAVFNLSNLIEGWQIGLQEIGEGGKCILIIPSEVAYGEAGTSNGVVPANAPLVFELDLLSVGSAADDYVAENQLITELLSQGVHIIVHDVGNEDKKPDLSSEITVTYEGRFADDESFDSNENITFQMSQLIEGWQVGLQEIGEGGSCTLIVPPSAGYGEIGTGTIPPNSVLIFDIELHSVN